jgi:hypothetical protein
VVIGAPVKDLRDVEFNRLKAVLSQIKIGLDTSSRSLASLRRTATKTVAPIPMKDRSQFDFAYQQVRACEVALRTSIDAASTATPEQAAERQARVADAYEAYARAVTVARSAAKLFIADNGGNKADTGAIAGR